MAEHTPTPWYAEFNAYAGYDCMTGGYRIKTSELKTLFVIDEADADDPKANAAFIVRAVNNFDDLLRACRMVANWSQTATEENGKVTIPDLTETLKVVRAAIQAAEKEMP